MSRQEREALRAWLDADPAMRAAWDGFRGSLARSAAQIAARQPADLDELGAAAMRVRAEAGEGQTEQ